MGTEALTGNWTLMAVLIAGALAFFAALLADALLRTFERQRNPARKSLVTMAVACLYLPLLVWLGSVATGCLIWAASSAHALLATMLTGAAVFAAGHGLAPAYYFMGTVLFLAVAYGAYRVRMLSRNLFAFGEFFVGSGLVMHGLSRELAAAMDQPGNAGQAGFEILVGVYVVIGCLNRVSHALDAAKVSTLARMAGRRLKIVRRLSRRVTAAVGLRTPTRRTPE